MIEDPFQDIAHGEMRTVTLEKGTDESAWVQQNQQNQQHRRLLLGGSACRVTDEMFKLLEVGGSQSSIAFTGDSREMYAAGREW